MGKSNAGYGRMCLADPTFKTVLIATD